MARAKAESQQTYQAKHRYARISARKARLVMDLIRGEAVESALVKLQYSTRRASPMIRKVVQSAVANAEQEGGIDPEDLVVQSAFVDEGPTMKRWKPRSMGRAYPRLRRSCHLSVVVAARASKAGAAAKAASAPEAEAETESIAPAEAKNESQES